MSKLNRDFFQAVFDDAKSREDKIKIISDQLAAFFQKFATVPINNEDNFDDIARFRLGEADGEDFPLVEPQRVRFFSGGLYEDGSFAVSLNITLSSSGNIELALIHPSYEEDIDSCGFTRIVKKDINFDGNTAEETVSRILTSIQEMSITEYGPHITTTIKAIWTEDLGQSPETAPGYEPPRGLTLNS